MFKKRHESKSSRCSETRSETFSPQPSSWRRWNTLTWSSKRYAGNDAFEYEIHMCSPSCKYIEFTTFGTCRLFERQIYSGGFQRWRSVYSKGYTRVYRFVSYSTQSRLVGQAKRLYSGAIRGRRRGRPAKGSCLATLQQRRTPVHRYEL